MRKRACCIVHDLKQIVAARSESAWGVDCGFGYLGKDLCADCHFELSGYTWSRDLGQDAF